MLDDTPNEQEAALIADIWNALASVQDPCHELSGQTLSILDLGLVNDVRRVVDQIDVGLTLTEVSCTFAYRIIEKIEALAEDFPEVSRFRVVIQPLPVWTPARLSDRARAHYRESRIRYGPKAAKIMSAIKIWSPND